MTGEVLPAIRKTGAYGRPAADPIAVLNDPAAMRDLLLTYTGKVLELQAQVAKDAPTVAAHNRIAVANGSLCLRDTARALNIRDA